MTAGLHGVLVIDKPRGPTSAQVVDEVKRRAGVARAGHTGTLDPLATGVLPVCVGEATKLAPWLLADDKAYEAELELGVATDTLDADGRVVAEDRAGAARVTEDALRAALAARLGPSRQVPPMFSAVRQGRRRLHELARAGKVADRAPRPIVVHALDLVGFAPPRARVVVACSKGTYVRALVDDVGRDLGCGAHLTALRRTRAGAFHLGQAIALAALDPAVARARCVRPADALGLPRIVVPPTMGAAVANAQQAALAPLVADRPEGERFQLVTDEGALLAIAARHPDRIRFERVFPGGL